jgi:hypothetical protein
MRRSYGSPATQISVIFFAPQSSKVESDSVLTLPLFFASLKPNPKEWSVSMFDLTGKSAVVTGGASGIGEAIAARFKAAGAKVLVADIVDDASYITGQAIAVDGGWNIGTTAQTMAAGVASAGG